jgi:stage III sporulation protein AH
MKANKKKIIVLVSLVVLLAGVACLNYFLTVKGIGSDNSSEASNETTPTFFSTYRSDRNTTRSQEVLYLQDIMASTTADEQTISDANKSYLALVATMETETSLEGLIKSYGFTDCIVTISDGNVNVVVQDSELTVEEAAQILSVITSETDYTAADVVIIPYV